MKRFKLAVLSAVLGLTMLVGVPSSSHALSLMFSDGGITSDLIVDDGGTGLVYYIGSFGFWDINITAGINAGSNSSPYLDLSSVNLTGGDAAPPLLIALSETGFTGPINQGGAGPFRFGVGGTTDGVVSFNGYLDTNNTLFGMTDSPFGTGFGPFENGAFSATGYGSVPGVSGPFSMTVASYIVHVGTFEGTPQITSFNANMQAVPEPSILLLLGFGLIGCAGVRKICGRT